MGSTRGRTQHLEARWSQLRQLCMEATAAGGVEALRKMGRMDGARSWKQKNSGCCFDFPFSFTKDGPTTTFTAVELLSFFWNPFAQIIESSNTSNLCKQVTPLNQNTKNPYHTDSPYSCSDAPVHPNALPLAPRLGGAPPPPHEFNKNKLLQ
jgi:hypothetical protein